MRGLNETFVRLIWCSDAIYVTFVSFRQYGTRHLVGTHLHDVFRYMITVYIYDKFYFERQHIFLKFSTYYLKIELKLY